MSVITDYLRNSRLAEARKNVEDGQPVDYGRLATLQTLDLICIGQEVIADALDAHEKADNDLWSILGYDPPPSA